MAVFGDYQPRYAELGIPTFPMGTREDPKKPLVPNYARLGLKGSANVLARFEDAVCLGFVAGKRSGITVVDVDGPADADVAAAIEAFGRPKAIARSWSGKFHLYFRHSGEARRIRAPGFKAVDILGGGAVMAPPSWGKNSVCAFIEGDLEDLADLTPIARRPDTVNCASSTPTLANPIGEGRRNETLWRHLMSIAPAVQALEDLTAGAFEYADAALDRGAGSSLTDAEILKTAASAWRYHMEGRNFIAGDRGFFTPAVYFERIEGHPDAVALLATLRKANGARTEFTLANAIHRRIGYTRPRFRAARDRLVEHQIIVRTHAGGRGPHDPPRYAWGPRRL
jgi:hypothetical protein